MRSSRSHRLATCTTWVAAAIVVLVSSTAGATDVQSDIADQVTNAVVEVLGVAPEEVTTEARLREDLGATLTDVKEILMLVADQLGFDLLEEEAANLVTVGDVVRYVQNNAGDVDG
jgi:acyl carrier protein